jgi:hypothetical protein
MERTPRARQVSRSTLSSTSESSQRSNLRARTHSPEKPDPIWSRAPTPGASEPALATQIISSPREIAIAASVARVEVRACSAINCRSRRVQFRLLAQRIPAS